MKPVSFRLVGCALALAAAACAVDAPVEQSNQNATAQQQLCQTRTPRGHALETPVKGLVATGRVPLPSWAPDDEGYFHPADGYVEGGLFAEAADEEQWRVDDADISARAQDGRLRVVEWNVERGAKLDKAIRLMKRINADVWVLNETDLWGTPSGDRVVAREIARALGYHYVTATEFYERREDRRGSSGDAIVSRYPITEATKIDTPIFEEDGGFDWANSKSEPRCGQRSALRAVIAVGDVEIPVVALHLENKANSKVRKLQFEAVVDELVESGQPTIVAGDFNTISPFEGRKFRKYLAQRLEERGAADSFFDCSRGDDSDTFSAAVVVRMRIDWMLVQAGDNGQLSCPEGAYAVLGNDGSSDHKPVLTEFDLSYGSGEEAY